MSTDLQSELLGIFQALTILSPHAFSFAGESPVQVSQDGQPDAMGLKYGTMSSSPLVRDLARTLYGRYYVRAKSDAVAPDPNAVNQDFAARLSQANRSRERWDHGWRIYEVRSGGQIFVQKGDRYRSAVPGEYVSTGPPGSAPANGMTVSLKVARESFQLQPGFLFIFGECLSDIFDEFQTVRFYFNCNAKGAEQLVNRLTGDFNRYQIPFRFKCPTHPNLYQRADPAVLYVARRHFVISARLVADLTEGLADSLEDEIPLFTFHFRTGVGLAEDPGTGESFGMHRCRLVAEGVVDAWGRGQQDPQERLEAVRDRFKLNGFDLSKPHLNPSSTELVEPPQAGGIAL